MPPTKCTDLTKSGTPCKAWAVPETKPPRCAAHGGSKKPPGAPPGNQNAKKHGVYAASELPDHDLGLRIVDLGHKIGALSQFIDDQWHTFDNQERLRYLNLLGQLNTRLSRLQRDRRELEGESAGGFENDLELAIAIVERLTGRTFRREPT